MTSKTFTEKLRKIIEKEGTFVVDTIDMAENKKLTKEQGFDDIILVAGENMETFALSIQKII